MHGALLKTCLRWYRALTIILCATVLTSVTIVAGGPTEADGPLLDLLAKARAMVFGEDADAPSSPVAVIAVDPRSLAEPELASSPRVLFGPIWAAVLESVMRSGGRVVGFDLLLSYSANRFLPDVDRPFLEALDRYRERVVLARAAMTLPAPPFLGALRFDEGALGIAELPADPDGTYRRVPAVFLTDTGTAAASLAGAVLHRAGAPAMPADVVVVPRRHLEQIPTYAIIDVLRCATQAPEVLQHVFQGKIVLIGSVLPEEDRKLTSGKYLVAQRTESPPLPPCGLRRLGASAPDSLTVPGVFLHAAAIEAVLTGRVTSVVPAVAIAGVTASAAAGGAALGLLVRPWVMGATVTGIALALVGVATCLLERHLWVPIALPLLALLVSPLAASVVRYLVVERARQRIQQELVFLSGLPRWMLERMADGTGELDRWGDRREVTVMFADLSGFTRMSTQVSPELLAAKTSHYLTYIVQQVEASGGWVNQLIGDAVMAIWGAPVWDQDHAVHAVQAALGAAARISQEREADEARGDTGFDVKIGLNSGQAVVGRLGAAQRGTYTAAGETVNLAARLESVPALYHCQVVIGPRTAELIACRFLLRELDTIKVKGIERPIPVFEPLAELPVSGEQGERVRRYADALALYRAARFAEAAALWEDLARGGAPHLQADHRGPTGPPAMMAKRARQLAGAPPQAWEGVWVLTGK